MRPSSPALAALLATLSACAGVSQRPDAVRAESLPVRELSAGDEAALAGLVEACELELEQRRYDEAERSARRALAIDPRSARPRAVLGIVKLQRANEREPPDIFLANSGEADTVLAEQLAPGDAFVAWVRARFLAESGHLSAAAAAAEAALERTAGAPPEERARLLGLAGTCRYELGEERAALPLLQAYAELRPEDATASFRIGSCLMRMSLLPMGAPETEDLIAQNHAEAAARAFARCVERAPGDEDAALAVGAATLRAAELAGGRGAQQDREQRLATAVEQFTAVAERFPSSAEARFRLGVAEEARDRIAEARAAYEAALARDEAHLGSLLNLAALLDTAGERAESAALLRRALALDPAPGGLSDKERARIEAWLAR